jgi:hypothetical protein
MTAYMESAWSLIRMMTRALVIDEPWIGLILTGMKSWEMRSTNTKIRGLIGLIRKGSGQVVGVAELVDCQPPLSAQEYAHFESSHRIPPNRQDGAISGGWTRPWVLSAARSLRGPVPYRHPPGAVIWVTLDPEVIAKVREFDPGSHA